MASKAAYVRRLFGSIAPRYDLLNSLLSLRQDRAWRRFAAAQCRLSPGGLALDVATGTAELARQLARVYRGTTIVGVDFSSEMLAMGRAKLAESPLSDKVHLLLGDALRLPFADNSFDAASTAFALRNVASLEGLFAEMTRVVKPGGRVVSLELTRPSSPVVRALLRAYLFAFASAVGGLLSGQRDAYRYLPRSIFSFATPQEVQAIMEQAGLCQVETFSLSLGLATVHVGRKPAK